MWWFFCPIGLNSASGELNQLERALVVVSLSHQLSGIFRCQILSGGTAPAVDRLQAGRTIKPDRDCDLIAVED
jgi:hypothetical protein